MVIRRGHNRTIVAIAHKLLEVIYILISRRVPYKDATVDVEEVIVRRNAPRWIQALKKFGYLKPDGVVGTGGSKKTRIKKKPE